MHNAVVIIAVDTVILYKCSGDLGIATQELNSTHRILYF